MPRRPLSIKKAAIVFHRWLGVFFCLPFAWWFVSGIFMMYWGYPEVTQEDRWARLPALNAAQVRVTPEQAFAALDFPQAPGALALSAFGDGRPVYRFRIGGDEYKVYADTGRPLVEFPPGMNLQTAAAWTGQSAAKAKSELLREADQWTVGGIFRSFGPLWKYSWPNGEQVYVSEATGEVVQYTNRSSRLGAYLGAIPHWLYFTPLRRNGRLWSRIVIWTSGVGTIIALSGLVVGIGMVSPRRRYRREGTPAAIPYRGSKRLHMILGLSFGILAITWAFSGMLSMDPFPVNGNRRNPAGAKIQNALRGAPLKLAAFTRTPAKILEQIAPAKVKELEFTRFAGEPVYVARIDSGQPEIITVHGKAVPMFAPDRIREVLSTAFQPGELAEISLLKEYDAYYLDRDRRRPLPVILVRLNDSESSRYYIDPRTADLVGSYSSRAWVSRWLYHGLHSWNLPWLYNHRPAWDIFVLVLMLGGASLSITSGIMGFQLVWRNVTARREASTGKASWGQ